MIRALPAGRGGCRWTLGGHQRSFFDAVSLADRRLDGHAGADRCQDGRHLVGGPQRAAIESQKVVLRFKPGCGGWAFGGHFNHDQTAGHEGVTDGLSADEKRRGIGGTSTVGEPAGTSGGGTTASGLRNGTWSGSPIVISPGSKAGGEADGDAGAVTGGTIASSSASAVALWKPVPAKQIHAAICHARVIAVLISKVWGTGTRALFENQPRCWIPLPAKRKYSRTQGALRVVERATRNPAGRSLEASLRLPVRSRRAVV
jgi:hypothetical protein